QILKGNDRHLLCERARHVRSIGFSWLFVALLVASNSQTPPKTSNAQPITWWSTHALDKIHPQDAPPQAPSHSVNLMAARNEFEPFQLALHADKHGVPGVDVEVSDLVGASATISS